MGKHHVHHHHEDDEFHMMSQEEEEDKKKPLKMIGAIALALLLILTIVPYYGLKSNPSPAETPTLGQILSNAPTEYQDYQLENLEAAESLRITALMKHSATKLASYCKQKSAPCYSKAMFYFVRDNIQYVTDPRYEYIESPEAVLNAGGSDCDGQAVLLAQLLKTVNIQSRLVITSDHAFVQAYLPEALNNYKTEEHWVSLDPTCKQCDFGEVRPHVLQDIQRYIYL